MDEQFLDTQLSALEDEQAYNLSQSFSILLLYDPVQRTWRGWLMIAMCIVSLPLNMLLFCQTRNRTLPPPGGNNQILQHLSVANCVTAVFCLLTKGIWDIVVGWYLGDTMCKMMNGMEKFALYANTYLVVALSLQRVINFIFSNRNASVTKKRSRYLTIGAWSLSSVCAIPQVFGHAEQHDSASNITVCQHDFFYYDEHSVWANYMEGYMHVVLLYLVPVTMIITSSAVLSCTILKRMKRFGLAHEDMSERMQVEVMSLYSPASRVASMDSASQCAHRSKQQLKEVVMVTRYCCRGRYDLNVNVNVNVPHPRRMCATGCSCPTVMPFRSGQLTSFSSGNASGAESAELVVFDQLRRSGRSSAVQAGDEATRATMLFQKARLRSVQVAATTVGCYVICWSPYYVFQMVIFAAPTHLDTNLWDVAAWLNVIGQVYIIVHPLLYGAISIRNIRRRVRKIRMGRKRKSPIVTL